MRRGPVLRLLVSILLLAAGSAHAWTVEIAFGSSIHAPNTLHVRQAGHPDHLLHDARYYTRGWSDWEVISANYYSVRVGRDFPVAPRFGVALELELLHDKAYLANPDGVVQHFELTDGINSLFLNLAADYRFAQRFSLVPRVGVGLTITAPASVVRGRSLGNRSHGSDDGFYQLAGLSLQGGLQLRWWFTEHTAFTTEARAVVASSHNRISGGTASALFRGLHLNVGLLVRF